MQLCNSNDSQNRQLSAVITQKKQAASIPIEG